jgi:hypothetical protein
MQACFCKAPEAHRLSPISTSSFGRTAFAHALGCPHVGVVYFTRAQS